MMITTTFVLWPLVLSVTMTSAVNIASTGVWTTLSDVPLTLPSTLSCYNPSVGVDAFITTSSSDNSSALFVTTLTSTSTKPAAWTASYASVSLPIPAQRTHLINSASVLYAITNDLRLFTASTPSSAPQLRDGWVPVTPTASPAVVMSGGFASWVYNDRYIVVFGGTTSAGVTNTVWSYDTTANSWSQWTPTSSSQPSARAGMCCAVLGTSAYCFGGTDGSRTDLADVWKFDNVARAWTQIAITDIGPFPRRNAACAVRSNELVVLGGVTLVTSTAVTDTTVRFFSLTTLSWRYTGQTVFNTAPVAFAMCSTSSNRLIAVGGVIDGTPSSATYMMEAGSSLFAVTSAVVTTTSRPSARWGHVSVQLGPSMLVAFGATSTSATFPVDVWTFDPTALQWSLLASNWGTSGPSGRVGAAAATRGTALYVFGGRDASGIILSELWRFSTVSLQWTLIAPDGGFIPTARCFATAFFMTTTNFLVIGSGRGAANALVGDWWALNISIGRWVPVATSGVFVADSGIAVSINANLAVVGLGRINAAGDTTASLYTLSWSAGGNPSFTALSLKTASSAANFQIARYGAVAAAIGEEVLVCGGVAGAQQALLTSEACFSVNLRTLLMEPIVASTPSLVTSYSGGLVYMGATVYSFGGLVSGNGVASSTIASATLTQFAFPTASVCASSAVTTGCVGCAAGWTTAGGCTSVALGNYVDYPGAATVGCPAGTYGSSTGASSVAFCLPCPSGTYASTVGSTRCTRCTNTSRCALGSSADSTMPVAIVPSSAVASNYIVVNSSLPGEYNPALVPAAGWYVIIAVCALVLLVAIIGHLLYSRCNKRRRAAYFNPAAVALFQDLFNRHVDPTGQLLLVGTLRLFTEPLLKPHALTGPIITDLFNEYDCDGTKSLDMGELLDMVASMVDQHLIAPFHDFVHPDTVPEGEVLRPRRITAVAKTKKEDTLAARVARLRTFRLAMWDYFTGQHRLGQVGDPVRVNVTPCGGAMTLLAVVVGLLFAFAVVVQFIFNNLEEAREMLPVAVVAGQFGTAYPQGNIIVTITASIAAVGLTATNTAALCVVPGTNSTCRGVVYETWTDGSYWALGPNMVNCSATVANGSIPATCTMTYACLQCGIGFGSNASVDFSFPPEMSATRLDVSISTETGIRASTLDALVSSTDSSSVVNVTFYPPVDGAVFAGRPSAIVAAKLTPVFFKSAPTPLNAITWTDNSRGYYAGLSSATAGRVAGSNDLPSLPGIGTRVQLFADTLPLMVTRKPRMTEPETLGVLFGGLCGAAYIAVLVVQCCDRLSVSKRTLQLQTHKRQQRRDVAKSVLPSEEEHDPYFSDLLAKRAPAPVVQASEDADEDTDDKATAVSVPRARYDPVEEAVNRRVREFEFRKLDIEPDEREAVAGLVAADVPLHVAVEHLRVMKAVMGKDDKGNTLDSAVGRFPAVDPYLKHTPPVVHHHSHHKDEGRHDINGDAGHDE